MLLALTVLAALAVPAGAAVASPPTQPPRQIRQMEARRDARPMQAPAVNSAFTLKTGNGYEVEVLGLGESGTAYVNVTRNGGKSSTGYAARGTVSSGRLKASFGDFGTLAMRFRPAANATLAKPKKNRGCKGRERFVNRTGTFVGDFHFRGEDGYISIAAKRAKGHVVSVAAKCERRQRSAAREQLSFEPSQNGTWGPEAPYLEARWKNGVRSAEFIATGGKQAVFYAGSEEILGAVARFRYALLKKAPGKDVKVSNAMTSGRVSPPPPFSGTGSYRAAPDGKRTWSGSLSVNFPGAEHYSLTGPPFRASIGLVPELFLIF
jgi:hypothetical protein